MSEQQYIQTPVGKLYPRFNEEGALTALSWDEQSGMPAGGNALKALADQVLSYFEGKTTSFNYPISFEKGTDMQKKVWKAMLEIPYGETSNYSEIGAKIGAGARPVANACGKNPIPILVPCHRVLAKTGLGGYSGGEGAKTKEFLLALEANNKS